MAKKRPRSAPRPSIAELWARYEQAQLAEGHRQSSSTLAKPASGRARAALAKTLGDVPAELDASLALHDGDHGPDALRLFSAAEIGECWTRYFQESDPETLEFLNADETVREIVAHPGRVPIGAVDDHPFVCIDRIPGPAGVVGQVIVQDGTSTRLATDFTQFLEYVVLLLEARLTLHDERYGFWVSDRAGILDALRARRTKAAKTEAQNSAVAARSSKAQTSKTPPGALLKAASDGDAARVRRLLAEGAAVDAHDRNGQSALLAAVRADATECIAVLLEHGPDLAAKGGAGSPLMAAAYLGDPSLVGRLLDLGAPVDDTDQHGATALIVAIRGARRAREKHELVVHALLDAGADPNHVAAAYGASALHFAMEQGVGAEIVGALLEHGADPNAKSSAGETPIAAAIEHATSADHDAEVSAILRLLIDAGARRSTRYYRGTPAAEAKRRGLVQAAKFLSARPSK